MVKKNIIEINGKSYDSRTGKLLGSIGTRPEAKKSEPVSHATPTHKPPATKTAARHRANHAQRHPEASKTLMRHVVKKPGPSLKRRLKVQGHIDQIANNKTLTIPPSGKLRGQPHDQHLKHAGRIAKSGRISHFSPHVANVSPAKPLHSFTPEHKHQARPASLTQFIIKPHTAQPLTTSQLLERAVMQATSHQQPPVKHSRRRKQRTRIGAAMILAIALLILVVTQNADNAQLQTASAKAGFNASLPAHKPGGFSQADINYGPGTIAVHFRSNSDSRRYTIVQQPSAWNSAELRNTFVAPADTHYQTVATAGHTVYLYGQHNATWVSDGIWYLVQTDGALSDHQLIELASSS